MSLGNGEGKDFSESDSLDPTSDLSSGNLNKSDVQGQPRANSEDFVAYKVLYEEAKKATELYSILLNATTDAIVVYDMEGRAQYVNNGFTEIFGWTLEEVRGKRIPNLPDSERAATMRVIERVVLFGERCVGFETRRTTKDGRLLDVSISASCYRDKHGVIAGMMVIVRDITESKTAERERRIMSERLELALRGADLGLWDWNIKTGTFTLSEHSAQMVGYELQELGPTVDRWRSLIHRDDLRNVLKYVDSHLNGFTPGFKIEYRILSKSGAWIWILERGKVIEFGQDGYPLRAAGTFHDVTERKIYEVAVKQSEANYRAIFNAVGDAIFIHDIETGSIVDVNERFTKVYGYSKEEALKLGVSSVSVEEEGYTQEKAIERVKKAAAGQPQSFEWRARTKDGRYLWVEVNLRRVSLEGKERILAMVRDITDKKKAEELLLQSELLEAVAELATGVAHNFNNLLQKILVSGQSALLKLNQGDSKTARSILTEIIESSKDGSETVKRLQSFAQLRSDVTEETDKVFDLTATVRDALEMSELLWRTIAAKNGISISVQADLNESLIILGRSNDLFEVALNLLRNAIEAISLGGFVKVRTFSQDGHAILEVEDNGTGISAEDLPKIFDPFFTTKGFQSTGMGLAGAYGIVSSHGGSISVETEKNSGSKFQVSLPLASTQPQDDSDEFLESETDSYLSFLVIDDDEMLLKLFEEALQSLGQNVRIAYSGSEALEIIESEDFDVITCDLGMPHMNGWEVGKRIKALFDKTGRKKPPFILLTGWGGQTSEQDKIIESDVAAVIEKPIDIIELINRATKIVKQAG